MAHVDHIGQARTQEIVLFGGAGFGLHRSIRNCRVLDKNLPNPATRRHQKHNLYNKTNVLRVFQSGLTRHHLT
jgi:hypothetical protein